MNDTIIRDKDGHPERWECAFCGGHTMLEITPRRDNKEVIDFCPSLGDISYGEVTSVIQEDGLEMYVCSGCGDIIAVSFERLEAVFGQGLTKEA